MSGPRTVSPGARCGTVTIPSSKSHVHRLLIAAALGESPVSIRLRGLSRDILATADCLRAMGAEIGCTESRLSAVPPDRPRTPNGEAVDAFIWKGACRRGRWTPLRTNCGGTA